MKHFEPLSVLLQSDIDVVGTDRERNSPQPDFAVLRQAKPEYRLRHPYGDELILVVEVSVSSLRSDATTKRDLYARAGVQEYWIVDVAGRRVIVHRAPRDGAWQKVFTASETESISVEAAPEATTLVAALLPEL